jgi:hypothetical protein
MMRFLFLLLFIPYFGHAQKWLALDSDGSSIDDKKAVWMNSPSVIGPDTGAIITYLKNEIPNLKTEDAGLILENQVHSPQGVHYRFVQTCNGRKVFRGSVKINLDLNGRVLSVFDHTFPIHAGIETNFPDHGPYHTGLAVHYDELTNAKLDHYDLQEVYFMEDGILIPAIRLEVVEASERYYELVLNDAARVIYQNDLLAYAAPQDSTATLWVFNPDPLTTANQNYGAPYADSFDQDVLELNAQRVSVQMPVKFENDTFFLENDFVKIQEFSLPAVPPVTSLLPVFNYTRAQSGFEDVNAYYHLSYFQNYIQSLGFTNIVDYQIAVDVHALNGSDNSNFNAGFNPPRLQFGEGGVDDAEDMDVIIHEYGHAIMHSAAPGTNTGTERKALEEATGDYFASSYSRFLSPNRWEDVFTWDGHNEYWPGRSSVSADHYPEDLNNNLYTDADIWSATLMQIWGDIGREATDAIMIQAAFSFSEGMTMPQAAVLFLQADTLLFGGANFTPIRQRLYDRGLIPWNVGIEDVNGQASIFEVFNSAGFSSGTGDLRITSTEQFEAKLFNALGQELSLMKANSGLLSLASVDLKAGVYFLELTSANHRKTVKLVRN